MKFDQLIEYNLRNIFLQKSQTKYGGEISSKLFSKNSKLSISLDQQSEFLYSCFIVFPSRRLLKYIAFTSNKVFFKKKEKSRCLELEKSKKVNIQINCIKKSFD